MKKSKLQNNEILVISREVECSKCSEKYDIHTNPNDEGFGHAAVLYEDKFSRTWFYHSLEQGKYLSASIRINELNKIYNFSERPTNIEKANPIGATCPNCHSMKYDVSGNGRENRINAYNIFDKEIDENA